MNPLLTAVANALARVGDAWDATAAATRQVPRQVRTALAERRYRRTGIIAAAVVLAIYLWSIGDLAVSTSGRWASAPFLQAATENLLRARAPYLFEPVLAVHPSPYLALLVSPLNLLLGGIVAALVGANVAVAGHAARHTCRCPGYGRLFGALPAFLLGFACCAPTLLLALGTGTTAALLPVLLPLRPVFYPLTLTLLVGTLAWGSHRFTRRA